MAFPDGTTTLIGLAGHPVAHSLSPPFYNAALRHDGRNAIYLAFDVPPEAFPAFVTGMRAGGARGLTVTMPHKRAAFDIATQRTDDAEATLAANTLVFAQDGIFADNTDVEGVRRALEDLGETLEGTRALLVGAGGAGAAAGRALVQGGAVIWVANRTAGKAQDLCRRLGDAATPVPWEALADAAGAVDVIVNATSVGLGTERTVLDVAALEQAAAGGCSVLLDLVYGPGETRLVRDARRAGLRAADGLSMLVFQGAASYRRFWGAEAPLDVMRRAALDAAGRT
jgi:shikimate dehydrogenase